MKNKIGFMTANGLCNVTPKEAYELCEKGAILIDVREDYMNQYKRFYVKTDIQIPYSKLEKEFHILKKENTFIIGDAAGVHSSDACMFLMGMGFEKIFNLAGGIVEWEHDGMPLSIDNKEKLSGSCMCQLKPRNA